MPRAGINHISPYTYCAGDPVNLVDPEGEKIEDPDKLVMKFRQQIEINLKAIKEVNASLTSLGINKTEIKQIQEIYQTILEELDILEKSDDTFRVVNNVEKEGGVISWDDGIVLIQIDNNNDLGLIGHELKHAYQFTQGEISFNSTNGNAGLLYDIHDEYNAFLRQACINSGVKYKDELKKYSNILKEKYNNLKNKKL